MYYSVPIFQLFFMIVKNSLRYQNLKKSYSFGRSKNGFSDGKLDYCYLNGDFIINSVFRVFCNYNQKKGVLGWTSS
jgi:hypothetical protein